MPHISTILSLFNKTYSLARPYGRKKLVIVFLWVLAQGTVQVIGVTSIFPFLGVAAEPDRMRESQVGKWILSALPPMDDHRLLLVSGITAIALLFISNALNLWSEVARVRYGHQFGHWLRMRLIRRITSQPYSFFLHHNSSVLMKKVTSDVYQYVNGVLLPLLDSGARLLTVVLLLSLVCIVNPDVAFYAGTGLGLFYVGLFLYLNRRLRATSSGMNNAQRASWHEANQLLSGIKPVKVHRAEEHFISRFAKHSAVQANLLSWVPVYANGPRYLVEPLAFGGLVLTVLILAIQGKDFTSVIPVLGVVALAGYRLIPTLQLLYGQVAQLTTMSHHLDEIYEEFIAVEHQAASHDDPARPQKPLSFERTLTLENVSFLYSGAHAPILKDISLTIPKNSSVAFIGRTGCGKSTLLDLILTLQHPTSGRLLVDGKELSQRDSASWLAGIGYVPQDIFLIDDTVTANIALGVRENEVDHRRLKEVCAIAQILPIIERDFPEGFQTVVGERGVRLSGGQRQRIGLARALYHRPQILILDEATSALDQATEADLVEALEPLKGTLTMLIVAHRPATVERCSVVYALESGRAVAVTHPCHPVTEQA